LPKYFEKKPLFYIFTKTKTMKIQKTKIVILTVIFSIFLLNTKVTICQPAPDLHFCTVSAWLINSDSVCVVGGSGPIEFNWDDGSWEDMFAWAAPGGMVAVKYSPAGYPFQIIGGALNVGDGSFPIGANFLGNNMRILIFDDDGPGNLPGTILDSLTVTVDNYEWVYFDRLDATIEEGDFYIGMKQLNDAPSTPPVGVDTDVPTVYKSYTKNPSGEWQPSVYNDFMIRAYSCSVQNDARKLDNNDVYWWYEITRVSDFDPENGEGPEDGNLLILDSLDYYFHYTDTLFYTLDPGYYAYAVKVYNEGVDTSGWYYTNAVYRQITGTQDIGSDDQQIRVFPNPVSEELVVEAPLPIQSLIVYNSFGQVVFKGNFNRKNVALNLSSLNCGIYFVSIETENDLFFRKVIKI
jgi:hypothetical protein